MQNGCGKRDKSGLWGVGNQRENAAGILREASLQFAKDHADLAKDLTGTDVAKRDAATQVFNEYAADQFGVKGPGGTASYNGDKLAGTPQDIKQNAENPGETVALSNAKGAYDVKNKKILINDSAQNGSTQDYVSTDGHELDHHIDQALGRTTTEAGANRFGAQTSDALLAEVGAGQGPQISQYHEIQVVNNQASGAYDMGNTLAGQAEIVDPKILIEPRNAQDSKAYNQSIKYLKKSSTFSKIYTQLDKSPEEFEIQFVSNDNMQFSYNPNTDKKVIQFDPNSGLIVKSTKGVQSPALGLAHEMAHAKQYLDGTKGDLEEDATRTESKIAKVLKEPTRSNYGDADGVVRVGSPTYSKTLSKTTLKK